MLSDAEVEQFWEQGYFLVKGVLSREEAEYYRNLILGLVPPNLDIPEHWHAADGRIKPIYTPGNHTFDAPDFLPLFQNEKLYAVVAQLASTPGSPRQPRPDALDERRVAFRLP